MKNILCIAVFMAVTFSSCTPRLSLEQAGTAPTQQPSATETTLPTRTASPAPTRTPVPTATSQPSPQPSPTLGPTATWAVSPSGKVVAPILLYHHVNDDVTDNRYVISTAVFEAQLQALRKWGYSAVPISTLVEVLIHGGPLPERTVVITFDDGNQDIYQNAFPIMKRYGDVGTFFIVGNRVGSPGFVDADQLKDLTAAGWEIGSHSWSHIDITKDHDLIYQEVALSRVKLEKTLGVAVNAFAYPFGATDPTISQKVQEYGYRAAVGLGTSNTHTWGTLFYLSRQEVRRDYSMQAFSKLLPYASAP